MSLKCRKEFCSMNQVLIKEDKFSFLEIGEGQPIVLLHGLMGGLSNFEGILNFFPHKGYKVIIPELPVYSLSLTKTSVKSLSEYVYSFLKHKKLSEIILLGNSLGGHIGLLFAKNHSDMVKALVLTGSSGLYENNMGDGYPKRGDYNYIKTKSEAVFYDPKAVSYTHLTLPTKRIV